MSLKLLKGVALFILCAAVTLCACSCSQIGFSEDDLIAPPKPTGDLYKIQEALDRYVDGQYKLKFPTFGKYRSAFIPCDLDNDGENECYIVFYATVEKDSTQIIHLNLISRQNKVWQSRSDATIQAAGIEKVEFADITGTGMREIAVGYNVFSSVDKQMVVYALKDGKLTERFKEAYSKFAVCDLDNDNACEITVISLDSAAPSSKATVYAVENNTVTERGSLSLDPSVSQYSEPLISTLPDGVPALFLDGAKGNGMITELIYLENGKPVNPFYDKTAGQNTVTRRNSTLPCMDVDKDGRLDIPVMDAPIKTVSGEETVYLTRFINYNKKEITTVSEAYVNYIDGYYLRITADFLSRLSLDRSTDERTRAFYLINEDGAPVKEVFRIKTVEIKNYDPSKYGGFFKLGENTEKVYLGSVTSARYESPAAGEDFVDLTVTKEQLSDMFSLISE